MKTKKTIGRILLAAALGFALIPALPGTAKADNDHGQHRGWDHDRGWHEHESHARAWWTHHHTYYEAPRVVYAPPPVIYAPPPPPSGISLFFPLDIR